MVYTYGSVFNVTCNTGGLCMSIAFFIFAWLNFILGVAFIAPKRDGLGGTLKYIANLCFTAFLVYLAVSVR